MWIYELSTSSSIFKLYSRGGGKEKGVWRKKEYWRKNEFAEKKYTPWSHGCHLKPYAHDAEDTVIGMHNLQTRVQDMHKPTN